MPTLSLLLTLLLLFVGCVATGMAISTTSTTVNYTGNGATTAFPVTFQFMAGADLVVTRMPNGTTTQLTQTLGVDYTVSGGGGATGTVNMTVAPANGDVLTIKRSTLRTQSVVLQSQGALPPATLTQMADRAMLIDQEQDQAIANATAVGPQNTAAAAPTTGTWTAGTFFFNTNPGGGILGWVCTASGTPGTWQPVYVQNVIQQAAAAPVAGTYTAGAIVWNSVPALDQPMGWICTAGGTPGIWQPFYTWTNGIVNFAAAAPPNDTNFPTGKPPNIFTNYGSSSTCYFNLPHAAEGLELELIVIDGTHGIHIYPQNGEYIQNAATQYPNHMDSTAVGSVVKLRGVRTGVSAINWVVTHIVGAWTGT